MAVKPEKEMPKDERAVIDDDDADRAYDIAVSISEALFYDPEHLNTMITAAQRSKDPSQIIGQSVAQILIVAYNKANKAELNLDDRVWAADEGVLDTILNEAAEFLADVDVTFDTNVARETALRVIQESPPPQAPEQQGAPQQPQQAQPQPMGATPQ